MAFRSPYAVDEASDEFATTENAEVPAEIEHLNPAVANPETAEACGQEAESENEGTEEVEADR